MKKSFIMASLFCLLGSIAHANSAFETSKPIICGPLADVIKELQNEKEETVFTGQSPTGDSAYALFYNEKSKTFTVVQFNGTIGCVIGLGVEGRFKFKGI